MQHFLEELESVTPIVWQASWQAACLAILACIAMVVLGNRIAARWRFVLGSLVFIRLALPSVPTSPASMFPLPQAGTADGAEPGDDERAIPSPEHQSTADIAQRVQPFVDYPTVSQARTNSPLAPPDQLPSNESLQAEEQHSVRTAWSWSVAAAL